jgi:hypothetical protein
MAAAPQLPVLAPMMFDAISPRFRSSRAQRSPRRPSA